jgi:small basic protein
MTWAAGHWPWLHAPFVAWILWGLGVRLRESGWIARGVLAVLALLFGAIFLKANNSFDYSMFYMGSFFSIISARLIYEHGTVIPQLRTEWKRKWMCLSCAKPFLV